MNSKLMKDVIFAPDDLALLRLAVEVVNDNYDAMSPVVLDCKPARLRALQAKIATARQSDDALIVRLSKEDMHDLGRVVFMAAETFEDLPFEDRTSMQALYDLDLQLSAMMERRFSDET